ncbi:MAG: hypothetical protein JJT87_06650 [Halomonas sp.]|uniref:DsrE family protein n=1 Tax=unclassified Halomonas TaxID=2609666 RepID=UPI0009907DB8|nr:MULTISPECIES: DsrE family protein [unclassified Halomonas]AQU83660.1 hypothetical protein B2G49_14425 [Halomonas sp. 'Soap Lake \
MRKFTLMAGSLALALPAFAVADHVADHHVEQDDQALIVLTSSSVQTQSMAMILGNAMRQQGTDLHILLCDAAGDLAVEGFMSEEAVNTPPSNPAGEVKPEGMLKMLMGEGVGVEVCAIYLPNTDYTEEELLDGVGVAAPGAIAEMMRDPAIPVYSF